jgi:hypothetical protein
MPLPEDFFHKLYFLTFAEPHFGQTRLGEKVFVGVTGDDIGGGVAVTSLKREPHFRQKPSPSELWVPHLVQYIDIFASIKVLMVYYLYRYQCSVSVA